MQVSSGEARLNRCTVCKQEKVLAEFHKCQYTITGTTNRCKACKKLYSQKWYKKNKAAVDERNIKYYREHREEMLKFQRARRVRRRIRHSEGDVQ